MISNKEIRARARKMLGDNIFANCLIGIKRFHKNILEILRRYSISAELARYTQRNTFKQRGAVEHCKL